MFVGFADQGKKRFPIALFNGTPTQEDLDEIDPLKCPFYKGNILIYGDEPLPKWFKDTWIIRIWFAKEGDFDHPVKNLPRNLVRVNFGKHFNHKVNNLPEFLKYLRVGYFFKQRLDYLPKGLEKLVIENPEYPFDLNHLPSNLKKLVVSKSFEKNIVLPEGCVLKRK